MNYYSHKKVVQKKGGKVKKEERKNFQIKENS